MVVLYCDFQKSRGLRQRSPAAGSAAILTVYVDGLSHVIRAAGGALSSRRKRQHLRAVRRGWRRAGLRAQRARQAVGAIEGVIADLNNRLGRHEGGRLKISVVVHAGYAAIGEIGSAEPPMVALAIGEAADVANDMRKARRRARSRLRGFRTGSIRMPV